MGQFTPQGLFFALAQALGVTTETLCTRYKPPFGRTYDENTGFTTKVPYNIGPLHVTDQVGNEHHIQFFCTLRSTKAFLGKRKTQRRLFRAVTNSTCGNRASRDQDSLIDMAISRTLMIFHTSRSGRINAFFRKYSITLFSVNQSTFAEYQVSHMKLGRSHRSREGSSLMNVYLCVHL